MGAVPEVVAVGRQEPHVSPLTNTGLLRPGNPTAHSTLGNLHPLTQNRRKLMPTSAAEKNKSD